MYVCGVVYGPGYPVGPIFFGKFATYMFSWDYPNKLPGMFALFFLVMFLLEFLFFEAQFVYPKKPGEISM